MSGGITRKYTDYFLLFFLIATTGLPFFYSDIEFVVIGFAISLIIFLRRGLKYSSNFVFVFLCFLIIEILQASYFNTFEGLTFLGTFLRLGFAYYVAVILSERFFEYFFNIIYFFGVVSLIFFIPSVIAPSFASFIVDNICVYFQSPFGSSTDSSFYITSPNIIIYTFEKSLFVSSRNPGPFWEPGAFAVFIILALIYRLIVTHKIFTFKTVLLIIVTLTTTSTSGYIALFLLLVFHYFFNKKVRATKYAIIMILIYGSSLLYVQLEFLGSKAANDIELASETTTSRFGSALVDLKDFAKNPIIGYGRGSNRYGGEEVVFFTTEQHRNNGLTQLLVTYGFVIFIIYFAIYYKNLLAYCKLNNFNNNFALAALFVILILGFSQGLFTKPFFYALLFVGVNNKKRIG